MERDHETSGSRVAIITGAASKRGMGRATALRLASNRIRVVVTDLTTDVDTQLIDEAVSEIRDSGGEAIGLPLDVMDTENVEQAVNRVVEEWGRIDILFNNAGIASGIGPFLSIHEEQWQKSFDVHVFGAVRMIRAVLPHMKNRGGGLIINNASTLGLGGMPEFSAYGSSKFAVVGLTKHLAAELGSEGIRVNCICPGMIDTSMSDIEVKNHMEQNNLDRETAIAQLSSYVPLQRYGKPKEVADVVAFLCSEQSKYVTGVALPIAGGLSAGL